MAKVTVTLSGAFSLSAASIDDVELTLVGFGDPHATVALEPGAHRLSWHVRGAPDAPYKVSLSGDTKAWSEDFTMPGGRDLGSRPFNVAGGAPKQPDAGANKVDVTVSFKGVFTTLIVLFDEAPLDLEKEGATHKAKLAVTRGAHSLRWVVTGLPGSSYDVALGGAASFSDHRTLKLDGDGDAVSFEVKP